MAFMDDRQFVISQIRHSCVTSDDTGMSEIVIVNEETENEKLLQRRKFGNWYMKDGENGDVFDYSNSFDIDVSPMQGGMVNSGDHRKVVHERNRKDNKTSEIKCKNVAWKDRDSAISDSELSNAFAKKDIACKDERDGKPISKLSQQIKATQNQPKNPFAHYSKFDGEGYESTNKLRTFKIFFPSPVAKGNQEMSMNVCLIVDNARVQDLIGLIMCKYVQQGRKPGLKGDVTSYCLLIADELDGEVDFDLPALDSKETISKFDFKALALSYIKQEPKIPETTPSKPNSSDIIIKVSEEKQGSSKFPVDRWDLSMKVIMEKILKKRGLKRTGHEYVLVKKDDPGSPINMEATLHSMRTLEFQLVKRASIPRKKNSDGNGKINTQSQDEYFTCGQYKPFKVTMLHRFSFNAKSEVQLAIDRKTIEIHEAAHSNPKIFWNRSPKAVTIEMEYVVDSTIIKKSGNNSTFRIIYCSGNRDFKNYDFECTHAIAGEIVRKIELILNSSPMNQIRSEYQKTKDKRAKKA